MRIAAEFVTRVGCALKCHFCPQDKITAVYTDQKRVLTVEDFELMTDKLPPHVEVHFSGFTEPLLNPKCGEMALRAYGKGFKLHLYTTLMGLTKDQGILFSACEFEHVRIHVPDIKFFVVPEDKWIANHEIWKLLKKPSTYMTMGALSDNVRSYVMSNNLSVEYPQMLSRGGNLGWTAPDRPILGPLTCQAERWHMNVVLPNGDVVLCSMDYSMQMPVGNLLRDSYDQIYERCETYREDGHPPADSPCRSCEWSRPI